jgi:hypothetical protein
VSFSPLWSWIGRLAEHLDNLTMHPGKPAGTWLPALPQRTANTNAHLRFAVWTGQPVSFLAAQIVSEGK